MNVLLWPFKAIWWAIRKTLWVALFVFIAAGVGLWFGIPLDKGAQYAAKLPLNESTKKTLQIASEQVLILRYSHSERALVFETSMQPGSISNVAQGLLPLKAQVDKKCHKSLGRLTGISIRAGDDALLVKANAIATGICYENPIKLKGLKIYKGYSVKTPPGGGAKATVSMTLKPKRNSQTQEIEDFGIYGLDVDGSRFVEAINIDALAELAVRDALKPMLYLKTAKASFHEICDASSHQLFGKFGNGYDFDGRLQMHDLAIGKCIFAVSKRQVISASQNLSGFVVAVFEAIRENYLPSEGLGPTNL